MLLKEVWSFIELDEGKPRDMALKMASEAYRIGQVFGATPCGVIFASSPDVIDDLGTYGLEKVYFFQTKELLSPEVVSATLSSLVMIKNPYFFLFGSTILGSEFGARLAAALKRGLISNYIDIESRNGVPIARKSIYGGKAHLNMKWETSSPFLATADLDTLEVLEIKERKKPTVVFGKIQEGDTRNKFIKHWRVNVSDLNILEADIVIGVGKGVDGTFMVTIENLASALGAVVGGTRIALYNGLITADNLLGTSGNWITSKIYIAIGVSGAPQHIMGVKEAKCIIAINKSRNAPIFRYVDLGIVGDLYEVVPNIISYFEKIAPKTQVHIF